MPFGTIASYDADDRQGYIKPDSDRDGDEIPFDHDSFDDAADLGRLHPGAPVQYEVEGGMAGLYAIHVRRVG